MIVPEAKSGIYYSRDGAGAGLAPALDKRQEVLFQHPDGVQVHMLQTPEAARLALADDILNILVEKASDGDTVLLSTGNTSEALYPVFIDHAHQRGIDLTRFNYGHIDNYAYDLARYPKDTDEEDFEKFLLRNFISPARIPLDHFFPIRGRSEDPTQIAADYDAWLERQHIVVAITGAFGPEPVVHFAFMRPEMDLEGGVVYIELSPETVERDQKRATKNGIAPPPDHAITLGLRHLRRAQHIFNINCGPNYAERVRLALTGPLNPNVIGTYFRTAGFGQKVHIYLDTDTAQPVRDHFLH